MADALAQLEAAETQRLKVEYAGKAGKRFVDEVKESLLFSFGWGELLSAAPTAIALIGACHVASSSDEAAAIDLGDSRPGDSWHYLKVAERPTLRACLVNVGDQGARTFRIAGQNMSAISGSAGELTQTVTDIIKATQGLPDPSYARGVDTKLKQLSRLAANCTKYADETDTAFGDWLLTVCEFHTASVQKHGTTEQEREANISAHLTSTIEASYKEKDLKSANDAAQTMKASLQKAEKAFEKANDDVPSAWETCAMSAINGITQAAPSIIAQALPVIMAASNPISAVTSVAAGFGRAAQQGAANAPGGSTKAKTIIKGAAAPAAAPALKPPTVTPPADPAYAAVSLLAPFLTSLNAYLTTGPNNGVDWAKFKDQPPKDSKAAPQAEGTKGLTWLLTNLREQEKSANLGTGEPSQKLKEVFVSTIKVVEEIKTESAAQAKLSSQGTDATKVKAWQDAISKVKSSAAELEATAKTFPGTSTNAPSLKTMQFDIPKTDYSAQNAALSAATEKLALNAQALSNAQETYQKAADNALKVQQQLSAIQTKLAGLEIAGKALEKVKEILFDCMAILVELKIQIAKIKSFFAALSVMVKMVVETKVQKFDEEVSSISAQSVKRAMLSVNHQDIETIYTTTLQIKAYFDLLQTIAVMYTQIHAKHVEPGLHLVQDLTKGIRNPEEMRPKREALNTWSQGAQAAVNKLANDQQSKISEGLETRMRSIADQTQMLEKAGVPPVNKDVAAAMKIGGSVVTDMATENLPTGMRLQANVDASDDF